MVRNYNKKNVLDFWTGKNVFITGHNGFKGSWLTLRLLLLGANVSGYSLPISKEESLFRELSRNGFEGKNFEGYLNDFTGDINDLKTFRNCVRNSNPDIIFHLAAQPLVRESYKNPIKTWQTNVMGTLNLLESVKSFTHKCSIVLISSDKVYKNNEWVYGYRENDVLGGHDPYSASKAAMEIVIESWRNSFCGNAPYQTNNLFLNSARAGNVIGGGDWSQDRLLPDVIKSLHLNKEINIRNPKSRRPWQHVLEPLQGYIMLAQKIYELSESIDMAAKKSGPYNFGPNSESNKSVDELIQIVLSNWEGTYKCEKNEDDFHEAELLHLVSDKAKVFLNWEQKISFEDTVKRTIKWYKSFYGGKPAFECCLDDIKYFEDLIYYD